MTPRKRMAELIEHGAVLSFTDGRLPELTLAAVRWYKKPLRIRWCAIFPEHQGHVHENEYDRVEVYRERDVAFYDADGRMTISVCPYEYAAKLDPDVVLRALTEWRQTLALHNNVEQFRQFFEEDAI